MEGVMGKQAPASGGELRWRRGYLASGTEKERRTMGSCTQGASRGCGGAASGVIVSYLLLAF